MPLRVAGDRNAKKTMRRKKTRKKVTFNSWNSSSWPFFSETCLEPSILCSPKNEAKHASEREEGDEEIGKEHWMYLVLGFFFPMSIRHLNEPRSTNESTHPPAEWSEGENLYHFRTKLFLFALKLFSTTTHAWSFLPHLCFIYNPIAFAMLMSAWLFLLLRLRDAVIRPLKIKTKLANPKRFDEIYSRCSLCLVVKWVFLMSSKNGERELFRAEISQFAVPLTAAGINDVCPGWYHQPPSSSFRNHPPSSPVGLINEVSQSFA